MDKSVNTILRQSNICAKTRLSRSSLYEQIAAGAFPPPVKLGARSVGWLESEVDGWIAARVAERDAGLKWGAS
jgi:prophage regulatory protein